MTKFWPIFLTATIVTVIVSLVCWISIEYRINRDIDSVMDRATIAANQEDMTEHVRTLKKNMERHGMTAGHIALVFKTSITDLALHYQTVNRILDRLENIKEMGEDKLAHQMALEDLRQVLSKLPRFSGRWMWVHYGWWLLITILALWTLTMVSIPEEKLPQI